MAEACDFTALSPASIYRAIERGDLPFVKVGRSLRFPRVALRIFLTT